MNYTNSIEEIVEYVQKCKQSNGEIVVRIGLRMNGALHIGNILPILSCFILGERIIELGYKYKVIIALVDVEDDGRQIPFVYQRDPSEKYKSLADSSIDKIKTFVEDVGSIIRHRVIRDDIIRECIIRRGMNIEFHRVSNLLENSEFRRIIEDYLSQGKNESKINVLCNRCKSINRCWSILDKRISFTCQFCNIKQIHKLVDVEFAVDHDLLGAMEDSFFPLDIHIIGRDHELIDIDKNDTKNIDKNHNNHNIVSSLEKRESYALNLLKKRKYITFLTPLVLGKNKKKMSKSEMNGIFLEELREKYGKRYVNKLYDFSRKIIDGQRKIIDFDFILKHLFN